MAIKVNIPTPMRQHAGGKSQVEAGGATVQAVLDDLGRQCPGITDRLFEKPGQLRRFVNVYLNNEDIRYLEVLNTAVKDGDEVAIIPAVAGGSEQRSTQEIPEGAAVFPRIPAELGINPLLLATLHALVFLSGSDETVVHPTAADEALDAMADYLQRLAPAQVQQTREDIDVLVRFARQEKWPRGMTRAVTSLMDACGVGELDEEEEN